MVVAGCCIRSQSGDEIVPRYSVNGRKICCENAWRKRAGAGADAGAGVWCRTTSGVAEKDLDRDRIAEQRLIDRDGPDNHRLNGRGVRITHDRAVECWNNYWPSGIFCRSRGDIQVSARTRSGVRTNPIIVGRPWLQSGYSSAIDIADVQVVVAVHVTAERVARRDIQQVAFRVAYAVPSRHETAARRRRPRNHFNRRGNLIRIRKISYSLQSRPRLMRRDT